MTTQSFTPWYEALYENFEKYDDEPYTQATLAEVDFIEQQLADKATKRILDVGCGTGRHSLEFARRGYSVLGLDLSEELLAQAREQAQAEELDVEFVHGDARELEFDAEFDLVTILCEGGFSLVETDAMDRQIIAGASRALRPGGVLILTAPSAVFMLANLPDNGDFDPLTLRETFELETEDKQGNPKTLQCSQRYYTYPELALTLTALGLKETEFFAVTADGYSRRETPSTKHFELGVTAVKPK
jgi:SAM-dependent methyltransferase